MLAVDAKLAGAQDIQLRDESCGELGLGRLVQRPAALDAGPRHLDERVLADELVVRRRRLDGHLAPHHVAEPRRRVATQLRGGEHSTGDRRAEAAQHGLRDQDRRVGVVEAHVAAAVERRDLRRGGAHADPHLRAGRVALRDIGAIVLACQIVLAERAEDIRRDLDAEGTAGQANVEIGLRRRRGVIDHAIVLRKRLRDGLRQRENVGWRLRLDVTAQTDRAPPRRNREPHRSDPHPHWRCNAIEPSTFTEPGP